MGILGGSVPPRSQNPDPLSDQKNVIFQPVFRPGLYTHFLSSLLRLDGKPKILQMQFEVAYFYFVLIHLELKR